MKVESHYYGIVTMGRFHRGNLMYRVPDAVDVSDYIARFDAFAWDGGSQMTFDFSVNLTVEGGEVNSRDTLAQGSQMPVKRKPRKSR